MKQLILFLFLLLFLSSCKENKNTVIINEFEKSITDEFNRFNVTNFSYIVTDEKNVLKEVYHSKENNYYNCEQIIENFRLPLVLRLMINNSSINENTLLKEYIPDITDKSLKVTNLLKVSANQTEFNLAQDNKLNSYITKVLNTPKKNANFKPVNLMFEKEKLLNDEKLLKTLAHISLYFDSENVTGHLSVDSLIPNYFPNWYTRNIVYFAGWNVLKIDGHTIFWNFFSTANKSLLLLKVIDKRIFSAITYESKDIPSPFDNNKIDLLQSSLATNILKSLLVSNDTKKMINTQNDINKQRTQVVSSSLNFLFASDLVSHAIAYERMGKKREADTLFKLYQKNYPNAIPAKYLKQPILAEFKYVPNNFDGKKYFELKENTKVRLFGSGQLVKESDFEYRLNTLDCIELYLDMPNKKNKILNLNDDQYMYRFNYGYKKISGIYHSTDNILFSKQDPNDSVYILEVRIPWKTLGDRKPKVGDKIGLNMFIADNDMNEKWRKSGLTWSSKEWEKAWNNPSKWGTLMLTSKLKSKSKDSTTVYCSLAPKNIKIDGKIDNIWHKTRFVEIDKYAEGSITSTFDNSGRFKTLWDKEAIYFLFQITDNIKNTAGVIAMDKGWIENISSGEIAFRMLGSTETPFFPTFSTDKTFVLKAGKYLLKYTSNEGHSVEKFYGKSPLNCLYGVVLYKSVE